MVTGLLIFLGIAGLAFATLLFLAGFAIPYAITLYIQDMVKTKVLPKFRKFDH